MDKSSTILRTETEDPRPSSNYPRIENSPVVPSESYRDVGGSAPISPIYIHTSGGLLSFGNPVVFDFGSFELEQKLKLRDEEIKLLKNKPEEKIIPINFLSSEKLRLKTHIAVAMKYSPEDENWIVDSPELNVYGVGRDEDEALDDFKNALEESYFSLKKDKDKLGPRLEKEWGFFNQVIEEK